MKYWLHSVNLQSGEYGCFNTFFTYMKYKDREQFFRKTPLSYLLKKRFELQLQNGHFIEMDN